MKVLSFLNTHVSFIKELPDKKNIVQFIIKKHFLKIKCEYITTGTIFIFFMVTKISTVTNIINYSINKLLKYCVKQITGLQRT